ncbi:hypothetical protein [Microvirga tunisiensis]|uniref:Conjugal transfer protein n=1 Tax=Microvirga tunisiensis TaxID=2108360 RepID=A0A5N7MKS0_9HYPH|nr:hypothetical protein [Microvirga tunisiensis]MPR08856.1 hypothetical protein [Microvirga tunisiensis]MPR27039.1 hypothetical protein [Microvirga tunisiensis]
MNRVALALFAALGMSVTTSTFAQVPVEDAARLKEEDRTARCMLRSRTYKDNTLQPTRGVKESVVAPKAGGASMNAGTSDIIGPGSTLGVVNGIDVAELISGILGGIGAVQGKNFAAMAQSISALSAAIEANMQGLNQGKAQIGAVESLQGAWGQNSQARIGTVGIWGQAIQAGSIRLQYENDRLIRMLDEASQRQKVLTYDPADVRLVDEQARPQQTE